MRSSERYKRTEAFLLLSFQYELKGEKEKEKRFEAFVGSQS